MREALAALTVRGRAFLAAGATAFVCAMVLGHDELVRVGALLLLLPLATAFYLGRSRYRLGLVRSLSPGQVAAGQQARVQLDLTNDGRMPTGLLLDRKSTRLNSSHVEISYAVFCLKKKKKKTET